MSNDKFLKIHKGEGFSDHLPIFAEFSIQKGDKNPLKQIEKEEISTILDLYKKEKLIEPIFLEDVVVIYKEDDKAIIKKQMIELYTFIIMLKS